MKLTKYKFKDICLENGFIRGPFGSALKKSLFVEKGNDTYKVYEQCVPLEQNKNKGNYYITGEYFRQSLSRFEVKHNDFLVSCSGVNYGAIYHLQEPFEKGVINQALLIIRINNEIADYNYFKYLFRIVLSKAITICGGDSTIPNFPSMDVIKDIDVYLPSLQIQQKIGNLLESIEHKLSLNNSINDNLQQMAKTIYDYWFTQFDFPDENGKPYRSSGGKMVWNEQLKREIPAEWEVCFLGELCNFKNGINYDKAVSGNKTYKIINVRNITSSSLLLKSEEFDTITLNSSKADNYLVSKNDIIIARSGSPGATRLLLSSCQSIIYCGFIICCTPIQADLRNFLTFYIKSNETANNTKSSGSILKNVSQDTLKEIPIFIPSQKIIDSFNDEINRILSSMQNIIYENQQLISIRDWLLPMLMNGQATIAD